MTIMWTGEGYFTADLQHIGEIYRKLWSTNTSDSSFKKIETVQNTALRTATGTHKIASIDHLHQESLMLKVKDHSDILSAQYLVNCLEVDHVCHGITNPRAKTYERDSLLQTSLNCSS